MSLKIRNTVKVRRTIHSRRIHAVKIKKAQRITGSYRIKRTIFPQTTVKPSFSTRYSTLRKNIKSHEDAATFYMLVDATCAKKAKVDIEKVFVNVFKPQKIALVEPINNNLESLEILMDKELMNEIKENRKDADKGRLESWDKLKAMP